MRKIASLLLLVPLLSLAADIDVALIAKKIDALKNENRVSAELDYRVYDPFLDAKSILKSESFSLPKKKSEIILQTILNNRALIGGKWYSVGNIIQGGVIESIGTDYIVVLKNKKRERVFFKKRKDIITHNKE